MIIKMVLFMKEKLMLKMQMYISLKFLIMVMKIIKGVLLFSVLLTMCCLGVFNFSGVTVT